MDILNNFALGGYSLLGYILPFLVVLTIVVFFHELGHYLVARWNGVKIDAFAVGFGSELMGFTDTRGTRWKLCAVPLGGYVKFAGDMNAASRPDFEKIKSVPEDQRAGLFESKSVGQRAAVVLAGPVANFILAILIFAGTYYFVGRNVIEPVVTGVVAESAAEEAGILPGDIIRKIDDTEIESFTDIPRITAPMHGIELTITVERNGKMLDVPVTPRLTLRTDRFGNEHRAGIVGIQSDSSQVSSTIERFGVFDALMEGVHETGFIITRTLGYLGAILSGRESAEQLSGPIGIAKISGEVATLGPLALISLTAVLSVSIGLLNLFPVPMLDGGHLVFYAYEAIAGKPMGARAQEYGYRIGFVLVFGLFVFATSNDVFRLFG